MSQTPAHRPPVIVDPADRWNKPKMAAFLRELACTHCVATAAKAVGMSRQSAYKLRNRLKGEPFDIAWEAAFQHGYDALHQAALERALHGWEEPVFYKGEQVGTRPRFDLGLTRFLLAARNRAGAQQLSRYRAAADFYSERWDELLELVEGEAARWPRDIGEGAEDMTTGELQVAHADREREAVTKSQRYTDPDPLPGDRAR